MSEPTPQIQWSSLGTEDREKLLMVLSAFEEFVAGYDHFTRLGEKISPVEPLMRFISGATFHWFYLLYRGGETTLPTLRQVGCQDLVTRAEALLAVAIDGVTVGEFISLWRDKRLVHGDFTHHRVKKALFRRFEVTAATRETYRTTMQALADLTVEVQQHLWNQFPEARDALRGAWTQGAEAVESAGRPKET